MKTNNKLIATTVTITTFAVIIMAVFSVASFKINKANQNQIEALRTEIETLKSENKTLESELAKETETEESEYHLYPMIGIVTEIDEENDIVTITDEDGEAWQFEGIADNEIGDVCAMIMNDKGTYWFDDDEIVDIRTKCFNVNEGSEE